MAGHRRLSIMDPAGGAQPFEADGLAWVSNAEIFNHAELRERFGGKFSASDCAVLGPTWRALGDAAPAALDGQFAWVCVEETSGRWIAARDHAGVCPLYVGWHADGTFWFASEMKALVDDCYRVEIVPPATRGPPTSEGSDSSSGMRRAGSITPRMPPQTCRGCATS